MTNHTSELARRLLRTEWDHLHELERRVLQHIAERRHISRPVQREFEDQRTFGERVADRVAFFGGSWTFIFLFAAVLVVWVALNSFLLSSRGEAFDPYPYILLNLFLSMLAALQAPVIMMSQNRLAAKDRLDAAHDYEVNLKAELEIRALQERLDELLERRWEGLLAKQEEQLRLLGRLIEILGSAR